MEQFRSAARISNREYQLLVGPQYGVRWLDIFTLARSEQSLQDDLPGGNDLYPQQIVHRDPANYFGFPITRQFSSMMIEPPIYLRALLRDFYSAGGKIVVKEFKSRDEVMRLAEPVIFNCSGLGARELFDDKKLVPARGQLEVLLPQPEIDYGYIGDGQGMCEDFAGWLLGCDVKDGLSAMDDGTAETLYALFGRDVGPVLRRYESRFRPALVHGDCNPKNGLLTPGGGLVLVDWDEAVGSLWVRDYAGLTYWYSYTRGDDGGPPGDAGLDEARAAFFRGYGETGFGADELREIEWALHTSMAAGEMSDLQRKGDAVGSARVRGRLLRLLDMRRRGT